MRGMCTLQSNSVKTVWSRQHALQGLIAGILDTDPTCTVVQQVAGKTKVYVSHGAPGGIQPLLACPVLGRVGCVLTGPAWMLEQKLASWWTDWGYNLIECHLLSVSIFTSPGRWTVGSRSTWGRLHTCFT